MSARPFNLLLKWRFQMKISRLSYSSESWKFQNPPTEASNFRPRLKTTKKEKSWNFKNTHFRESAFVWLLIPHRKDLSPILESSLLKPTAALHVSQFLIDAKSIYHKQCQKTTHRKTSNQCVVCMQ